MSMEEVTVTSTLASVEESNDMPVLKRSRSFSLVDVVNDDPLPTVVQKNNVEQQQQQGMIKNKHIID
jgi:hypothetical protein